MYELTKISAPGWSKQYPTRRDVYEALEPWICKTCKEDYFKETCMWPANVDDLLWTPCGAEFMLEEIID